MNIRKRTSINIERGGSNEANTSSQTSLDDHGIIRDENDRMDTRNSDLPSDQSADEEGRIQ